MVSRGWTLLALVISWLFLLGNYEVDICFDWYVSTTIEWITITFVADIYGPIWDTVVCTAIVSMLTC